MAGAVRRIDIVSFDLDGTLVDTAGEIAEAANRTLGELSLEGRPVETIADLIGAGTRELMVRLLRQAAPAAAPPIDLDAAVARFAHHYEATSGTMCQAFDGANDALVRLRRAGVRLACVTNKELRFARPVLAACGMGDAFDLVVGGDTLAVKKPDGRVLAHVVATLGGAPEASAHVGDSRTDVEAARNAGVAAWAVPWGYDGGRPVAGARPDRLFESFAEIADAVVGA